MIRSATYPSWTHSIIELFGPLGCLDGLFTRPRSKLTLSPDTMFIPHRRGRQLHISAARRRFRRRHVSVTGPKARETTVREHRAPSVRQRTDVQRNAPLLKMDNTTALLELRRSMMLFRFEKLFCTSVVASRGEIGRTGDVYLTTSAGLPAVWWSRRAAGSGGKVLIAPIPFITSTGTETWSTPNWQNARVEASRTSPGSWSWLDAFSRHRMCAGEPRFEE